MATGNINLGEVQLSNTFGQWVDIFNGNMGKLDALPIPIEYGKNTTMEYLKFSNGMVLIYGRIEMGTKYPSTTPWGTEGFASDIFTIDFPIALTNNSPIVVPHVISVNADGGMAANTDIWCLSTKVTYTAYQGRFFARTNTLNNKNSLSLNMIIIGKWK